MANETILVVDADTKSQKVLEVSFKKAGYRVLITDSIERAQAVIAEQRPDLIVSDTQLPDGDGFEFCNQLNEHPQRGAIPFVFLTEQRSLPEKMRGFELGADEYLTKPIYIKEVTSRVEVLLQKKAQERLSGGQAEKFEGNLADVTMIDLLQAIEQQLRSGSIQINRSGRKGAVFFREGNILDAMCGKLQGEEALYRLMLWPDGKFKVEYHDSVRRADHIEKNSSELLLEGIRRLDKWNELVDKLPGLERVFEADYQRLPELLAVMPEEAGRVVRLFDGIRSLRNVIDDSPFDDITTLQIIQRLLDEDVLLEMTSEDISGGRAQSNLPQSNLEAWLAGADQDESVPTPFAEVDSSVEVAPLDAPSSDDPGQTQPTGKPGPASAPEHDEPHQEQTEQNQPGQESPTAARARSATGPHEAEAGPHQGPKDAGAKPGEGEDSEGGGHWKVHWDGEGERPERDTLEEVRAAEPGADSTGVEEAGDADKAGAASEPAAARESLASDDGLRELEEREVRRREEEAKQLLRQSGHFEAATRQPEVRADDKAAQAEPEVEPVLADGGSEITEPRRETEPLVGAVSRELEKAEEGGEDASPKLGRPRRATPVTTPIARIDAERAPADDTSPGIQIAKFDHDGDRAESDDSSDDMRSSAERRAASVEEAASVQREATRSVRESAPYPVVDREAEAAGEASANEQAEPQQSQPEPALPEQKSQLEPAEAEQIQPEQPEIDQPRRVTEEISSVEEDTQPAPKEEQAEAAQPTDDHQQADAPAGDEAAGDEPAAGAPQQVAVGDEVTSPLDEGAVEAELEELQVEEPLKVERSATDRKIVKAEYNLERTGAKPRPEDAAPAEPEQPAEPETESADATPAEPEPADESSAEESSADESSADESSADDFGEAETPIEASLADSKEKQDADEAQPEDEDTEAEPAAKEAEPEDEQAAADIDAEEEETPDAKEAQDAPEDAFFSAPLADESHEENFFSDGEDGDYDWEFEDVPKTSNRWMYFTALAVLAALTAVAIALFDGDDPVPQEPAEGVAAVDESAEESDEPAEEEVAQGADEQAPKEEVEPLAGVDADEATLVADESAGGVTFAARKTALVLSGVDPYTAEQRALQDPAEQDPADAELAEGEEVEDGEGPSDEPAPADQQQVASAQDTQEAKKPEPKKEKKAEPKKDASPGKTAYRKGQAALDAGNNSEAVKQLTRADKLGYRKASMYLDLATAHQLMGDIGSAKSAYKKFLDMQPSGKRADEVRSILERL